MQYAEVWGNSANTCDAGSANCASATGGCADCVGCDWRQPYSEPAHRDLSPGNAAAATTTAPAAATAAEAAAAPAAAATVPWGADDGTRDITGSAAFIRHGTQAPL